ncbi:MAG: glutamate--tRNA ligase [Silvanigrellales bacterium]|nr:glutamate--tRNA ligase [Silvanigrellales bacterium]
MSKPKPSGRPVRVRIAPSPTGDPHIGTAYIALFNYAFAKHHNGQFILRIEDTDQTRFRKDSERLILETLRWVGLTWDEGPDVGGPHAPYRQSERTELYKEHAQILLEKGGAYRCFCTPERLDTVRKERATAKLGGGYDRHCRALSVEESAKRVAAGTSFTVRLKVPQGGATVFRDELRGDVSFENEGIDDQVLLKSDGFPTYHLANVVDDHVMLISHVMRGEEWITSTPKHCILYDAFGWERPAFAHFPLLRNADKSKISKRKNPTSINYYRRKGVLPAALRNFLALMGWSFPPTSAPDGTDVSKEIFTTNEMVQAFDLSRFTLGGPVFDIEKLTWMNGQYLKSMSDDAWVTHLQKEVFSETYLRRIVPLMKERVEKFEDFIDKAGFFFSGDLTYDPASLELKGRTRAQTAEALAEAMEALEPVEEWSSANIQATFEAFLAKSGLKAKDVYMPFRIAVTGKKDSPPLFDSVEVLGKEIVRRRVRLCVQFLGTLA